MKTLEEFQAVAVKRDDGCHIWSRALNNRGYGVTYFDGKVRLAHRVMWYLTHGRWPADGLVLDHVCEVKACVNVEHLRELTNGANVMRSPSSPMNVSLAATECRNGHPYDETTKADSHGWRVCSRCPSRVG